jgi:hypothetical protein
MAGGRTLDPFNLDALEAGVSLSVQTGPGARWASLIDSKITRKIAPDPRQIRTPKPR